MFYKKVLRSKVNSCVFPQLLDMLKNITFNYIVTDGKYFPLRHLGFTASQDDKDHISLISICGFSQLHRNW